MCNKNERKLRKESEDLMCQLTLAEKIGMIHGAELFRTAPVERLGIPALAMSDGGVPCADEILNISAKIRI